MKSEILDHVVELTGWHSDHARAVLRKCLEPPRPRILRPGIKPTYPADLQPSLILGWAVLRTPAGRLLAAATSYLVPMLRKEHVLDVVDDQARLLMDMSAATIDRRLAGEREKMRLHGRSRTKPGSLLRSQIPIRTRAEWEDAVPGFVEIDRVSHEGSNPAGQFCFTLTVTDIATGLDGEPLGAEQSPEMGVRGPDARQERVPVPDHRHRFRQRKRVHQ